MQVFLAVWFSLTACQAPPTSPKAGGSLSDIEISFLSKADSEARIVKEIAKAKKSIRVQAYSFASSPIANAIMDARKKSVTSEIILDEAQAKYFHHYNGISTFTDSAHAIARNTIFLIDDGTVITVPLNFTDAAEDHNAEPLLIIRGRSDLAAEYAARFAEHHAHSKLYGGSVSTHVAHPTGPPKKTETEAETQQRQVSDQTTNDPTVYVTTTGNKYHRASCSYLRSSSIPIPLSQAAARYGPCSRCHPPTQQGSALSGGNSAKSGDDGGRSQDGATDNARQSPKGTRCTRRARSGGRCWQHGG
jgi:hypothetical protein